MTSQSFKNGGIHDGHFEYIQTTVISLFLGRFNKTCIKINGLPSTLLQNTHTAYIAFPFKQAEIIEAFNSTSRYLDDLLNNDSPYFEGMFN